MPINADTNRVGLSYVEEATAGITPASPIWKRFRETGSSDLKFENTTDKSKEIVPDRQVTDLFLTGASSSGSVNIEFSIDSYDDLLEGTFFNRWNRTIVRNDLSATLLITNIEFVTSTTGKIKFDSSVTTAPFLTNALVRLDGLGEAFSGAIVQITGGTFSSPDFFHEFTVLNGKTVTNITATNITKAQRCGYVFQDVLQATASPNTLTSATTDMTTLGFNIGEFIKIGSVSNVANDGFDTAADNGYARISAIATNVLTLDKVPTGWAADTNAGSKNIALFYDGFLKNGELELSYSLERSYQDHNPVDYEYFLGMRIDEMQLNNDDREVSAGSFNFMGLGASFTNARVAGSTDADAYNSTPFNTVNNINYLELDGVDITKTTSSGVNVATKIDCSFKNNLRGQTAIGNLPYVGVGVGQFDASGSVGTYFQNVNILNLLASNVDTSLRLDMQLGNRRYIFDFPRIKISSGSPDVAGVNEDVTADYGYQALKDADKGYTTGLSKISTY
jgi:hypothetical protein